MFFFMNRIHQNLINSPSPGQQDDHIHPKCRIRQQSGCPVQHGTGLTDSVPVFVWRCGGSLLVHQTSEAEVPGSHPASLTIILMRCRIIANNVEKSQGREGNLPLGQKKRTKKRKYSPVWQSSKLESMTSSLSDPDTYFIRCQWVGFWIRIWSTDPDLGTYFKTLK